jgi:tetratricopeptide (TPR) repeat protein
MSPEQISGSEDLDSRTDIYSCGVVLYQLISGHLPYQVDANQFFSAINKILNETPKNITTINTSIDASLAAVVHHAIEKKPENRFQTAHEFLKDLESWLAGEPIQSQQLSKWYWVKQAARKNKALVTGTALAFLGLLTGLVFAISFAIKEKDARAIADQEAESNRQVVQFINDLFVNADPTESLGEAITVKQVVEGSQYTVDKNLSDDPQIEAQIRLVLGNVFAAIEVYPSALAQYQKGLQRLKDNNQLYFELATQKIKALASNSDFEQLMQAIEQLKSQLSTAKLSDAEISNFNNKILFQEATFYANNSQVDKALKVINQLQQQTDLDTNQQFAVHKYRGFIHREFGEFDEAEQLFRSEWEKAKTVFGESHPITLDLIQELALTLRQKNKIAEALVLYDTLIEGMEQNYGENSLSTLLAKINKATAHMYAGEFAQADEMTAELLPKMVEYVGPMHQYTLALRNIRGGALDNVGKWDEALQLYQESLDLFLQSESKDNFNIINIPHNMAIIYNKQGHFLKSNELYQTYRPQCETILSLEHPLCIIMADSHADILIQMGEYQKARELLAFSNPALIEKYGADHPRVKASNNRLKKLSEQTAID